jgi:hypothetical protein
MFTDIPIPDPYPEDKPSAARMYDYYLGGDHNFEVDRIAAEQVISSNPDVPRAASANRAFLRRCVTFLVQQGIDQFLDLGSGLPTVGNVHEVAHKTNPAARVVYVDNDAIAVRMSQALLVDNPHAGVVRADIRQPEPILRHTEVARLLDLSRPVGVLLLSVLHFVPDDAEAYHLVRVLRDVMAPGSYLALSHVTYERLSAEAIEQGEAVYARSTTPAKGRTRAEIAAFFEGLDLVEPGLVYLPLWRPESSRDVFHDEPERSLIFAGVGRKA